MSKKAVFSFSLHIVFLAGNTVFGGDFVSKKSSKKADSTQLRIDPEKRLCPKFDSTSIALFPVASREEMGVRVVDDCAEEHMM